MLCGNNERDVSECHTLLIGVEHESYCIMNERLRTGAQ